MINKHWLPFIISTVITMVIIAGLSYVLLGGMGIDRGSALERGDVVKNFRGELTVAVSCNDRIKKCIRIDQAFGFRAACVDNVIYFVKTQQPFYTEDGKVKQCHIIKIRHEDRKTAFMNYETLKPENIIKEDK